MTLGFWLGVAAMSVLAVAFLALPLWIERRRSGKLSISGSVAALAIAPVAVALYFLVTTFDPDAVHGGISSDDMALLEQLAARLNQNPEDVEGWKLLGRSYSTLGDYARARQAFEQAWQRTENPDNDFKLSYAEAMLFSEPDAALGVAGDLIEEVLADEPGSQGALWLGGIVALEREDAPAAVDRFTALLATNPPPEIADIVSRQIEALTGSAPAPSAASSVPSSVAPSGPVIALDVSLGDGIALDRFGPNARLFVFALEPGSPRPIAAKQLPLSAIPGRINLSDRDNPMGAGRSLGEYESLTVVARISAAGVANEQSGDVFAEAEVDPAAGEPVPLVIDQVVP